MRLTKMLAVGLALLPAAAFAGETVTYQYDAKGRLVAVGHAGGPISGQGSLYQFDAADNRASVTVDTVSVADGGFETPNVGSGYAYNPSVSGATFAGSAGVAANGSAWGFTSAPDGNQVAFVQSGGSATGQITSAVSGMRPGQNYMVVFRAAQRPNYGVNPITVQIGGTTLGTYTPSSTSFATFTTGSFQATSATASLVFTGTASSNDIDTGIDSVAVVPSG